MNLEKKFAYEVYPKREVELVRGEGALLWDDSGNQYIDCTAGVGVANVGHANPAVVKAIANQAAALITCPGIFYNDVRGELMAKLVSISPPGLDKVFLCNSGTEAMEAALKFARLSTGKIGFISAMRGFHGRTMGALSATFKYRDEFEPLLPGNRFVPFNNLEKLVASVDADTAGIVLEVVQGEGGVRPADVEYMQSVRRLCDEKGVLLIVDEVQTGFGRTGRMFACEHMQISPDMMTLAKAMAGGIPMGAVLCSDQITPALGKHGSTFGGNPLACAAALAAIGFIEENELSLAASENGAYFLELLQQRPSSKIRDIRQIGLMVGVELKAKSRPVIESLLKRRILALPAGPTVVRLLPPLVITRPQLETVASQLLEAIEESG
jgi:acetylornithine/LysW-gamma-L-lysine aminotransferase